jgi:hypothetical protein
MELDDGVVKKACLRAAEMLSGIGYTGIFGSFHLLRDLNLQTNTVIAILHNMVAWQISQLDPRWIFHPKGGGTPDLTCNDDSCIQIKATSGKKLLGNRVSKGAGHYVGVRYKRLPGDNLLAIEITEILVGSLESDDWERKEGTQWAVLKREAQAKMRRVYP